MTRLIRAVAAALVVTSALVMPGTAATVRQWGLSSGWADLALALEALATAVALTHLGRVAADDDGSSRPVGFAQRWCALAAVLWLLVPLLLPSVPLAPSEKGRRVTLAVLMMFLLDGPLRPPRPATPARRPRPTGPRPSGATRA
jgi:hypothetical protein